MAEDRIHGYESRPGPNNTMVSHSFAAAKSAITIILCQVELITLT